MKQSHTSTTGFDPTRPPIEIKVHNQENNPACYAYASARCFLATILQANFDIASDKEIGREGDNNCYNCNSTPLNRHGYDQTYCTECKINEQYEEIVKKMTSSIGGAGGAIPFDAVLTLLAKVPSVARETMRNRTYHDNEFYLYDIAGLSSESIKNLDVKQYRNGESPLESTKQAVKLALEQGRQPIISFKWNKAVFEHFSKFYSYQENRFKVYKPPEIDQHDASGLIYSGGTKIAPDVEDTTVDDNASLSKSNSSDSLNNGGGVGGGQKRGLVRSKSGDCIAPLPKNGSKYSKEARKENEVMKLRERDYKGRKNDSMHCERWNADTNASNINHLSTTSEPGSDNTIDDINSSNQTQNKAYPSAVFPKIFSNSKDIIRAAIELEDEAVIKLLRNSVKGNPLFHSDKTWLSLSSFLVTKLLHILEDIDSTTNFQTFQVQSRIKKLRERCQRKFPKCFASIDNFLKFESDLGSIILKCIPEHTGLGHTANFKYYDPFRKCFVLSNSWGENWGDCGHFRIAEDDIFEVFNYQIVPTSIIDIVINDQAPKSVLDNVTKYKAAYNEHLKYILRCFESSAGILQELLTLEATLIKSCENGDVEAIRSGFRKASQLRWLDSFENCRVFKARDDNNIDNKLNINIALDQVGNTLLHIACYHNYPEIVKLLLSNEFIHLSNVKTVNFQNNTPLEIACIQGHPKLVELLLPSSSDNVPFKDKPSVPLLCACRKGNYDIVNQLLHLYYGPNGKIDGANQICLFEACKSNRIEIVELILSRGVDVNTIENASWTPIQVACAEKVSILIIKLLIRHGCKVLDRDIDGHCLTHRAYLHGCRIPVIELFLSKGVHIDEVDGSARTLLFNACIKDDTDMVAWLLSKGANIYIGDGRFNPFTFSVYQGLTDTVRLLLWERQVNEDRMFSSAFHIACMNSDSDMIAFLLQSGADVNAIDEKGRYPIEYAYSRGHFHIVRMIHNSPNFNIDSDVSGIFFACYHNLEDMVEFLISKNVDINVTNSSRGETPLHIACFKGHKGIVKLLLSQPNIDIDKTCNSGHSPLDYARSTASSASPSSSVGRDSANAGQFLASPRFFPAAGSLRRSRSFGNSLESTAGEHLMFRSCSKLSSLVPADTPVSYSGRPLARSMSNNGFTINTDEPFEDDIISMLLKAKSKCD